MILDSSAILSILYREEGFRRLTRAIAEADLVAAGAPTLVETGVVLDGRFPGKGRRMLEGFLDQSAVEEVPFGELHWRVAIDAYGKYGKGYHPARLNFGDCLTYATARVAGDTLLFVGDDFSRTDIPPAV